MHKHFPVPFAPVLSHVQEPEMQVDLYSWDCVLETVITEQLDCVQLSLLTISQDHTSAVRAELWLLSGHALAPAGMPVLGQTSQLREETETLKRAQNNERNGRHGGCCCTRDQHQQQRGALLGLHMCYEVRLSYPQVV